MSDSLQDAINAQDIAELTAAGWKPERACDGTPSYAAPWTAGLSLPLRQAIMVQAERERGDPTGLPDATRREATNLFQSALDLALSCSLLVSGKRRENDPATIAAEWMREQARTQGDRYYQAALLRIAAALTDTDA